jgi:hypothetical protein
MKPRPTSHKQPPSRRNGDYRSLWVVGKSRRFAGICGAYAYICVPSGLKDGPGDIDDRAPHDVAQAGCLYSCLPLLTCSRVSVPLPSGALVFPLATSAYDDLLPKATVESFEYGGRE